MQEIMLFENKDFGQLRMIYINGKQYFMTSDIARVLGYSKANNAISQHCRATLKCNTPISGKEQKVNFIPEGDEINVWKITQRKWRISKKLLYSSLDKEVTVWTN